MSFRFGQTIAANDKKRANDHKKPSPTPASRGAFSDTTSGPKGLLHNKRAILVLAGGDLYSESSGSLQDLREPYLRAVLGFIGITEVEIVRVARPGALEPPDRAGDRIAEVLVPKESSDRKESSMKTKLMVVAMMMMTAISPRAEAGPHVGGGGGVKTKKVSPRIIHRLVLD